MTKNRIGIQVQNEHGKRAVSTIQELEDLGIPTAWMPTGGSPQDSLTIFSAAAVVTKKIVLGSSIVPTYPRHPIVAVQQARVINQIAPGRFILGIGPSHQPRIENMYGIEFETPLNHTREYLRITRSLLHTGKVDYDGRQLKTHANFKDPMPEVPVMISALRSGSFELAGAESDGAISWVCPGNYLQEVALPAMKRGAEKAGRPMPPLVAHAPVCLHEKKDEVMEAVKNQLAQYYLHLPFYVQMFEAAGFPEATKGIWSEAMLNAVVFWGKEEKIAAGLKNLFKMGAAEVIVTPVPAGKEKEGSWKRTIKLMAQLQKEL